MNNMASTVKMLNLNLMKYAESRLGALIIYFVKDFDIVFHDILFDKLNKTGINKAILLLNWLSGARLAPVVSN